MRRTFRWLLVLLLLGLVGLTGAALSLTRGSTAGSPGGSKQAAGKAATPAAPVDQTPLTTARNLAAVAQTPQERSLGAEAVGLADHEVDLAFAQALRDAAEQPLLPASGQAISLGQRVKAAQGRVNTDQAAITRLTQLAKRSRGTAQAKFQAQLELAEAQLSLDQDELADARRDLLRSGGDEEAELQSMLNEHEKSESHAESEAGSPSGEKTVESSNPPAGSTAEGAHSLLARLGAWDSLRNEEQMLARARGRTLAESAALVRAHDALESKVRTQQSGMPAGAGNGGAAGASALSSVRQLSRDQKDLDSFDKRIDTEQELADVYGRWLATTQTDAEAALHRLIRSIFWVLLVLLLAVVADLLISRLFSGLSLDRRRLHTLRSVLHFTMRGIATVLILIAVFGPPRQLATILGLVGAGLAVALKDFIVAFLGWFVLIGRNGMRPGDWVEISGAQQVNGVQGKVIEVGLLFTVILETGNWTDAGHPTGRRVAFINSFAIEGYFFNFTTAGQWLWDEVQVGLPVGVDPYPMLDALQKIARKETEENAKLAEQDWKHAMAGSGLASFSAKPAITVRPTETGLNVVLRYIARADEREEQRQRMYRAAFEILHGAGTLGASAGGPSAQPETA